MLCLEIENSYHFFRANQQKRSVSIVVIGAFWPTIQAKNLNRVFPLTMLAFFQILMEINWELLQAEDISMQICICYCILK